MKKAFSKEFVRTLLELCVECEDGDTDNCTIKIPLQNGETLVVGISFDMEVETE